MYFEYRIVKIEKGLFLIEYKTAPYGVWHEVKNKQFKTKPKAGRQQTGKDGTVQEHRSYGCQLISV